MTGVVDLDREILMRFDDKDIFTICFSKNKYALKLCDEMFFRNLSFRKFPTVVENKPDITWKKFYLISSFLKNDCKSSMDNIIRYFKEKDKPLRVAWNSQLNKYISDLQNEKGINNILYNIIYILYMHHVLDMESCLKIIAIGKMLNKNTPKNFLDDFLINDIDAAYTRYLKNPKVIDANKVIKSQIDEIYKKEVEERCLYHLNF